MPLPGAVVLAAVSIMALLEVQRLGGRAANGPQKARAAAPPLEIAMAAGRQPVIAAGRHREATGHGLRTAPMGAPLTAGPPIAGVPITAGAGHIKNAAGAPGQPLTLSAPRRR